MITNRMTKADITQYIEKHNIDYRLSRKVFESDRAKKIQKNIKEYRKRQRWPIIFKEPLRVTLDNNEYFCILSILDSGKNLDYNAYLRIYNERYYEYYTIPVGLGKGPSAICSKFSSHFVDRFQTRCPNYNSDQHFLVSYLNDQNSTSFLVPLGLDPSQEIWRTTKSGIILMIDWTYVSYYRKLSEFSEDRQKSYEEYWNRYGQDLGEPKLSDLIEKMKYADNNI